MKKELFSNVFSLIWNLFIIYVCYSLCRLTFLLENFRLFSENLTGEYALNMFGAGIMAQLQISVAYFCSIGLYFLV